MAKKEFGWQPRLLFNLPSEVETEVGNGVEIAGETEGETCDRGTHCSVRESGEYAKALNQSVAELSRMMNSSKASRGNWQRDQTLIERIHQNLEEFAELAKKTKKR